MRLLVRLAVAALAVALCVLAIRGFIAGRGDATHETEQDRPVEAPSRVIEGPGQAIVELDEPTRRRSGIAVSGLSPAPYQVLRRGYGVVLEPTGLIALNGSYASARAQLQIARARLAASKTVSDRARILYRNQQNVSLAQLQSAEAALQTDQASLAAADQQVRTLAATAAQDFGPVLGQALLDGADATTRLIEQKDFLLQVTLPADVSLVPPSLATIQLQDGSALTVRFISPAARTDPRLQGMSFLYGAPASRFVLPGMNLPVSLASGGIGQGLAVPPTAIVWWQDRAWVYRQVGDGRFARTPISTSVRSDDGGTVVEGLPADTRIVIQGAQLLLSEEFRAQLQAGDD